MDKLTPEQLEKKKKIKTLVNDPAWNDLEEILMSYIVTQLSIDNLDTKRSNDEIAADIRGRQLAANALANFLKMAEVIKAENAEKIIKPSSFK